MSRTTLFAAALIVVLGSLGAVLWLLRQDDPAAAGPLGPTPGADLGADTMDLERLAPGLPAPGADPDEDPSAVVRPMLEGLQLVARLTGLVVDGAGAPVPGARVTLLHVEEEVLSRRYVTTETSDVTEDDGHFLVAGAPPGRPIALEAQAPGFAPTTTVPVTVESGQARDMGRIVLERGTLLTGRVSDALGEPLADALVRVHEVGRIDEGNGEPTLFGEALSDAEGRYAIDGLATRQYAIEGSREGYATSQVVLSFVLGRSETWVQDIELHAADAELSGVVLSPYDEPVPGILLRVLLRQPKGAAYFATSTVSDADGAFHLPGLAEGRYDIEVVSSEWYLASPLKLTTDFGVHTVRVHPGLAVQGRLHSDAGLALPRTFEVTIQPDGRTGAALLDPSTHVRRYADADPPGVFRADGLRPGTYAFLVAAPGFALTSSHDVVVQAQTPDAEVIIPLRGGGVVQGRIEPAPPSARVELRDADWDPSLALEHAFPTTPLPGLVRPLAQDGTFRVAHVPEGNYVVTLRFPDVPPIHVRDVAVSEGRVTELGVFRPQPGGAVAGTVLGLDGKPLAAASVTLTGDAFHQRVTSDVDGGFRFVAVPVGTFDLVAIPPGLWDGLRYEAHATVHVRADDETDVVLTLVERVRER